MRPAATQHHADNTLERLRGHHYSERGKKRRDCVCAAVVAQERKGTSQCLARAQAALLFASIHASWLTICKHFSNYCPLKHAVYRCVIRPILVTYAFIDVLLPYIHCPSACLYIIQTLSFIIMEPCVFYE